MPYTEPTLDELKKEEAELKQRLAWVESKKSGIMVDRLLELEPVGAEFRLDHLAGRAYRALYRKNDAGLWDQVPGTCESPHVINMTGRHLGFCVGFTRVADAVEQAHFDRYRQEAVNG